MIGLLVLLCLAPQGTSDDTGAQLLSVKRIFVDRLTGGETAAQMRDLLISSLQSAKLFMVTENEERADAILRGAAEDLIYTDTFSSSDSLTMRGSLRTNNRAATSNSSAIPGGGASISVGDRESTEVKERKHEALATVRLVNKDGDVLWSTIQESNGAKFRGASADVADKIARQLAGEIERLKRASLR